MMQYGPEVRRERLPYDYRPGDAPTFTIATVYDENSGALAGSARNVTTGSGFLVIDPNRETIGTCSAAGTTASIVDTARTEVADKWKYVLCTLRDATDGKEYTSRITGSGTGTMSVDGFPVAPAYNATVSDTYVLHGEPLLTWTPAGLSGNNGTVSVGPTNAMMYTGLRELHYLADFGVDQQWYVYDFEVR